MAWRAKWKDCWDEVTTCSAACRKRGIRPIDRALEHSIRALLTQRKRGATICPSEAARDVAPEDWRPLMERTRSAARRLVQRGEVALYQGGRIVDPSTARGPIRIGLPLTH